MELLLPLLAITACISPLLTLAWLWQVKEWRWDRILEHLRRDGLLQIFGNVRPGIFAFFVLAASLVSSEWIPSLVIIALCFFAGAGAAQFALGRQRRPVWTRKAMLIVATAIVLSTGIIGLIVTGGYTNVLPALMPWLHAATVPAAWILLYPVDIFLKRRIIRRARNLREGYPDLTVIGVTGSVGKTTTKELLACVLVDLHPAVTPAYVNTEIGVAQWLIAQLRVAGCGLREIPHLPKPPSARLGTGSTRNPKLFVVEMGAYRRGEIATICSFAKPTIGVVTHVGTQHIALFGSQENLFLAKSELVTSLPQTGRAYLNGDNDLCRKIATVSPCPVTIVGTGGQCDLEAFDIEETPRGVRFRVRETTFDVPLHGTHNVTNILLAIAIGLQMGLTLERMRDCLRTFTPLLQTFSIREESGVRILDDTHNSSAASVKATIAWARTQPEQRKTLLAAGLIEMGDHQSPAEQELGALASGVFERVIVIDPQSARNFADGGAKNIEAFSKNIQKVPSGSLLICTGRMPQSSIQRLLP